MGRGALQQFVSEAHRKPLGTVKAWNAVGAETGTPYLVDAAFKPVHASWSGQSPL